jgi:Protein of unknown function (DUF2892)
MQNFRHGGNLSGTERTWSTVLGTALSLLVFRGGSPVVRSLAGLAGAALLARAFAGHCGMKAAMTGQASLGEGLRDQWNRMSGGRAEQFDAQEDVEEWADPAALEEGLAVNKPGAASSATTQH